MPTELHLPNHQRKALLTEFSRGAKLIFENAEQLFREAEALRNQGSFARSLFLHQISMEECAKVEMIGAWATTVLMGNGVDPEIMASGFRSHKAKNHTNAYMAKITEEELEARKRGDWKESAAAFDRFKARFHQEMNAAKNASLYVDFKDARFSAPTEVVTEEAVKAFWILNRYFLQVTFPYLRLLDRIEDDDDALHRVVTRFAERIDDISKRIDAKPSSAVDAVLDEMLKLYKEERRDTDSQ